MARNWLETDRRPIDLGCAQTRGALLPLRRLGERPRLLPHPAIEGDGQVLDDDANVQVHARRWCKRPELVAKSE